jgi:hypothetical protein
MDRCMGIDVFRTLRCRLRRAYQYPGPLRIWNGEGMGRERLVHKQPGAKVDGIAPRKRRDFK